MKILVVTTHTDIDQRLHQMIQAGSVPDAEYSIVVEFFQSDTKVAKNFPRTFAIDDLRNREAIDAAVAQCKAWGPFDRIVATDEYAVFLAAEIRERLGLPGLWRADVQRFRDKVEMKKSLQGSSVRTPRLFSPEDLLANPELFPVIEKPRSYAGSKGIRILRSIEDLKQSLAEGRTFQASSGFTEFSMHDVEFEELIEGRIFHIDGLVLNSDIITCVASEYIGNCLNFLQGQALGSISEPDTAEQESWRSFAHQVIKTMQIPDGAFHLEAFLTPNGERVFLEVGIRPGGAFVVHTLERACGFNLDVAHMQCQLGIQPELPARRQHFGWLVFPKKFGAPEPEFIDRIQCPPLTAMPGLAWWEVPEIGSLYSGSFSYTNSLGNFLFCTEDPSAIRNSVSKLLTEYRVSGRTSFKSKDSPAGQIQAATP